MTDPMPEQVPDRRRYRPYQAIGLGLGPAAFAALILSPGPTDLAPSAWATAAVAAWLAIWWATEAVPLPATALLPLALLPMLGIAPIAEAAAPYANPLIFLFLGGFLIALAMQRWGLHRRLALTIIARAGTRPRLLIGGVMVATAGLSMWISNTASAMMMLPIGISLVAALDEEGEPAAGTSHSNLAVCMMLGIAYAASIGGLGTLIGSPPNALLASFVGQAFGVRIGFAQWMMLGLPAVVVLLPAAWLVLTGLAFPISDRGTGAAGASVRAALQALGPLSRAEKRVAAIGSLVVLAWLANPLVGASWQSQRLADTSIAILGAVLLFAIPEDWQKRRFLMDWTWARRVPWGVLLLFGGGLSLAGAIDSSGLAAWIGGGLGGISGLPAVLLTAGVALVVILLTELTSNTATTAAFLPVVGALALRAGLDPLVLCVPVALAASCAFMLPVATPPNAIVYGSGHVTIPQMIRAGTLLNVAGVAVATAVAVLLVPVLFGR